MLGELARSVINAQRSTFPLRLRTSTRRTSLPSCARFESLVRPRLSGVGGRGRSQLRTGSTMSSVSGRCSGS